MKNRMMFFKKTWTLVLALLLLVALSACGAPAEEPSAPPEENERGQQEEASYTTYSTQGVAFQVPADWTQAEGTDLFYATGRPEVYGLNGASPPWAPMSHKSSMRRWWSTMRIPISSPTSRRRRA